MDTLYEDLCTYIT